MRIKNTKRRNYILGVIVLVLALLTGCTPADKEGDSGSEDYKNDLLEGTTGLFLILEHNTTDRELVLYSYEKEENYHYYYNATTKFFDKYGKNEPKERFTTGRVIELEPKDRDGRLTALHISDEVWEQSEIMRFAWNQEKGVFTIADKHYSIKGFTKFFSNGEEIRLEDLWEEDVLSVVGKGTEILSVVVTQGHGTLKLTNTSRFDGSTLNLGDKIYAKIAEGYTMLVPEGTYSCTISKDGWGSTSEIEMVRGQTLVLDLEELKGPGPKKGTVTFSINVEDVKVLIDYKVIDHSKPVELIYGIHTVEISAKGYTSWKGKINVGAAEATIMIELEEESEEKEDNDDKDDSEDKDNKDTEKGSSSSVGSRKYGILP